MIDAAILKFEHEWREGDRDEARRIAKDYIERHADEVKILGYMSQEGIVKLVEDYKAAGDLVNELVAKMWIVAHQPAVARSWSST